MRALESIRQLDYTVIFARELAGMRHFYENGDGLRDSARAGAGLDRVTRSAKTCWRSRSAGLMFDDPPPPAGALSLQLAFRVAPDAVERCATELQSLGVRLDSPPTDQPWGHRTLFFRDPDGNVLEIYADI